MALLVELCAGTASITLWALGRCPPLVGYMGSKRRWSALLGEALGPISEVLLVDAGPWGEVWSILRHAPTRRRTAEILEGWQGQDPAQIWRDQVACAPRAEPADRVAQYLWLQARSAGTIPIWWSPEHGRWESPTGSRTEEAHGRGGMDASRRSVRGGVAVQKGRPPCGPGAAGQCHAGNRQKSTPGGARGLIHPRTVAERLRSLEAIDWSRVSVWHGDCRDVPPIPESTAYLDPPYRGCPRYAALLPRDSVLALALRWCGAGARVAISETESLPLSGWTSRRLTSREWVTASWPIGLPEQLEMYGAA